MSCDLLLYTHSFDGGGAERVMVQLANHWAAQGAQVALVVNLADGPLQGDLDDNVTKVSLDRKRGLLAAPALASAIRKMKPAGVFSGMTEQNITACFARRLAGYRDPVVTVEHNFMSTALAGMSWGRRTLLTRLMRLSYPLADKVTAVSAESARDLEALCGLPQDSVGVLYNPIWPMDPNLDAAPGDIHPWFGGPDPVLLCVGRLVGQKNHANLLDALARARQTRPLRLILLGEGPLLPDLAKQAAELGVTDAVDFAGFRRNVADFLHHADLFVLSSDREGLPLSLMEALKAGTPVVSTDCRSGPRELLEDGRHGKLVPVRDPDALAAAVLETLDTPPDRNALKARAANFATDTVARKYEELVFAGGAAPWRTPDAA